MPIKAGTVSDFSNSMAAAMEQAMSEEYIRLKDEPFPSDLGQEDRHMLFTAIAQGVVKHLTENLDAFVISTSSQQVGISSGVILSEGTASVDNINTTGTIY